MGAGVGRTAMPERHEANETAETKNHTGVNRRRFVKALGVTGGTAIAGSVFSSSAMAAEPSRPSVKSSEPVTGSDLGQLISETKSQDDVTNVMNTQMRETIQSGVALEVAPSEQSGHIVSKNISSHTSASDVDSLAEDDLLVSAVEHTLEDGNKMTTVALGNNDNLITRQKYEKVTNSIKDMAVLWNIVGENVEDMMLVSNSSSFNGTPTESLAEISASACKCNPAPAPEKGKHRRVCKAVRVNCILSSCGGACFWCSALGPAACLTCAAGACGYLIGTCCSRWKRECTGCPSV
ncbi:twin-arginine translocation signal domain-containing protein [Halococcus sp. IIIV-5B]|uniref:twin-arginine translocation signal domain-containing protein n=1 Tax=Halococcus sp. IIIV-5B TaxID=2321230 RepID=UPI000E766E30|nr:twin-arginine translocation signal domain-containing protein [Halococcus sp. IIIV-5B]